MNVIINRTNKIKTLLQELNGMLKMSVNKAINIGQLLSEQKAELKHGEFLPWLENNFDMSERTARNYMKLFQHNDKMAKIADLHEAYKQIEKIEYQAKEELKQKDNKLLFDYKRSGEKPEGWERRHDHAYKKMLDDSEFQKRKKDMFEKKQSENNDIDFDKINNAINMTREKLKLEIDADKKINKLKLNNSDDNIDQNIIFDTIKDYVYSSENNSEKLEKANNLLKFIRKIAVELQQESIA